MTTDHDPTLCCQRPHQNQRHLPPTTIAVAVVRPASDVLPGQPPHAHHPTTRYDRQKLTSCVGVTKFSDETAEAGDRWHVGWPRNQELSINIHDWRQLNKKPHGKHVSLKLYNGNGTELASVFIPLHQLLPPPPAPPPPMMRTISTQTSTTAEGCLLKELSRERWRGGERERDGDGSCRSPIAASALRAMPRLDPNTTPPLPWLLRIESVFSMHDHDESGDLDTFELAAAIEALIGAPPTTEQVV